ncbi:MAG: hypothetical protein NXI16_14565 [Alphaproteobacteria bacterium]|nr:hypothetical protein [Alphaproteobacteria bacterium]
MSGGMDDIDHMLHALNDEKFAQVVMVLEESRTKAANPASVNALLKNLRPRLVKQTPDRWYTAQRLFCVPFEELLADNRRGEKSYGKVPRKAIDSVWTLYADNADSVIMEKLEAERRGGPISFVKASKIAEPLWRDAAEVLNAQIKQAKSSADAIKKMTERLGGQDAFLSMEDIALFMEAAPQLMALRNGLSPRPIRSLDETDAKLVADTIAEIGERCRTEAATTPLMIILARLESPTTIKSLIGKVREISADSEQAPMVHKALDAFKAQVSDAVVGEMENRLETLSETETGVIPREEIAKRIEDCIAGLDDAAADAKEQGQEGQFRRRFERMKMSMKAVVAEKVIDGTSGAVGDTLKALDAMGLERPSTESLAALEDHLIGLRLARRYGDALDLKADVSKEVDSAVKAMKESIQLANNKAKDTPKSTDPAKRTEIEANLMSRVRMLELIGDANAANEEMAKAFDILDERFPEPDDPDDY